MALPDKGEKYVCARCKGEFIAAITRQEAIAEEEILFGGEFEEDKSETICGECYKLFMVWWNREGKYLQHD